MGLWAVTDADGVVSASKAVRVALLWALVVVVPVVAYQELGIPLWAACLIGLGLGITARLAAARLRRRPDVTSTRITGQLGRN
ncbi:hypothetical protein G7072_10630 [Nocardioides sp. HDW12B]|uniref:hypothetical protein n=1 Tax=Nocardioides sp. HDW12B TaxID=2714939 RepID=UPI00140812C7|nr:hypothetical protein [Nocardioides sp. HDW12B]QIK66733.1 hypothetical protein G7072_10630 [Nocardioides sp. HDW12B]